MHPIAPLHSVGTDWNKTIKNSLCSYIPEEPDESKTHQHSYPCSSGMWLIQTYFHSKRQRYSIKKKKIIRVKQSKGSCYLNVHICTYIYTYTGIGIAGIEKMLLNPKTSLPDSTSYLL